ncbi:MAG TPA: FAD:protein FMN transferase [Thermoguttaceae bacterium]|nr:FAD:protein FMN transferase [Thermoguttaceae bacterium]
MTRKGSRRDFLKGKSAADAMTDTIRAATPTGRPEDQRPSTSGESYFVRVTRPAMACEFEVRFSAGKYDRGTELALAALDLVETLEHQLSVFRESSEICRINDTAAQGPVEVEERLFTLLETTMQLHDETDGALDLTSGPLWEVWGFARREGAIPDEGQLAEARRRVGYDLVRLDPQHRTIHFQKPGVGLNLGSVGKGYALDRCAEVLVENGIDSFLIHGGGSSVLARGAPVTLGDGTPEQDQTGWEVGIVHPLRPERRLAKLRLTNQALATSGSWAQSFVHEGRRYSHILDPRSGRPAEGVLSATVIAPTATLADALSTAFFVLGPDKAIEFCRDRPEIGAVLACPIRHSGGVEIRTVGLPDEELTVL